MRWLAIAIVVITFAGSLVWDWFTPTSSDDWCYAQVCPPTDEMKFWSCNGRDIETYADAIESACNHWGLVNGRLANIWHIMWVPAGKQCESVFAGLMIGVFGLLLAYAGHWRRRFTLWSVVLATILMWVAHPWYNFMQSLDFQANYVWTSVMVSGLLLLLPRVGTLNKFTYVIVLLLGAATGAMHEGFTIPLLAYLFFDILRRKDSRKRYWWLFGFIVAGLVFDLAGGTLGRMEHQGEVFNFSEYYRMVTRLLSQLWIGYVAIALFSVKLWRNKGRRRQIFVTYLPLLAAMVAGFGIPVVLTLLDRVIWPFDLFSCLLIMQLVTPRLDRIGVRWSVIAGLVFVLLYVLWLVSLCRWEKKIGDELAYTLEQLGPREPGAFHSGILYIDNIVNDDDIPFYLMDIVNQPLQAFITNTRLASHFTGRFDYLIALPTSLRGKSFEEWPAVAGDNHYRGVWPYIAMSDSLPRITMMTIGPPTLNMSPIDRLLVMMRQGVRPCDMTQQIEYWPHVVMMPDSTKVVWVGVQPIARTMRHRPFVKLDTVPFPEDFEY